MHWLKVVRRKLNIEVVEHVLEEDLKRVIGSAFGVGGFEYSVFEGTPSVHRKTTIQVWKGERILGYVKVTRSEEVGRLFEREASFLKKITDYRLQITDDSQQLTVNRWPSGFDLSPTDDTDNLDFSSHPDLLIRSLASQEVARRIDTDFTPAECLFHTEDLSHTDDTECTEFFRQRLKDRWLTLRVPFGFDLSHTDEKNPEGVIELVPSAVALRLEPGSWILIQSTRKTLRSKVVHEWGALQEDFLKRLYVATAKEIAWEESDVAQALRDLREHVDWLPEGVDGDVVARRIDAVMERMVGKRVVYGAYHGDFTPWNMFVEGGELFVFDWEYAGRWYPMGLDRYHFWMQTAVFEKHWGVAELKRYMGSDEGKWIDGEMLEMYVLDVMSKYVMREGKRVTELGMFGVWATVNGQ